MITGVVTANRDAVVRLLVRGPNCVEKLIEAVIDTGFNGWLTLPSILIDQMELRWHQRTRVVLADGSEINFDVYEGEVLWNGKLRRINVGETNSTPLVGMALLHGCELNVQVWDGGRVIIESAPFA
jgi:clan AA aspartic protease